MKIIIPGTLPGLNEMISDARTNRMRSASQKKTYTELVMWCVKKAKLPAMNRINICITWYEKNKKRDPDNVQAGIKFILDGLKEAGVIINDGWKQIGPITHEMQVDKNNPRVEVEITEVT